MQHDSAKYQISGLYGLVFGMLLFALYYPEVEEVIGFIGKSSALDHSWPGLTDHPMPELNTC